MDKSENLLTFFLQQSDKIIDQTITHIGLTSISIIIACFIGLPLGISILRNKRLASMVLGVVGIFQTIPSIALLGFLIPLLGIGPIPAVTALFLYALLPIVRNTYTGIIGIDTSIIEAAQALGMTDRQILVRVQLPLALPVIMAGIRTAAIINVGVATLAAYIAAGGLGEFIFGGIALNNTNMILAGALPAAGLAILFDYGLSKIQKINIAKLKTGALILGMGLLILSSFYVIKLHDNKLLAGFTPEFMGRQDGYLGLKEKYGFKIPTVVISDAVMYKAAFEQDIDLISGYSTDGRLKAYDLITLQDDQEIFPPYYAAPLIRNDILEKYPELQPAIEMLTGKINDSIMTELNYQVDYRKVTPAQVAKEFLESNGMNFSAKQNNSGTVRLGSKIFGEQYILANIYKILIEGQTNLKVS